MVLALLGAHLVGEVRAQPSGTPAGGLRPDDGLVRRDFSATGPDRLWPAVVTEHATTEGKHYLCAVRDVFSNRIVGYSIDVRMKSRLAVAARDSAVARCGDVGGCTLRQTVGLPAGTPAGRQYLPAARPGPRRHPRSAAEAAADRARLRFGPGAVRPAALVN